MRVLVYCYIDTPEWIMTSGISCLGVIFLSCWLWVWLCDLLCDLASGTAIKKMHVEVNMHLRVGVCPLGRRLSPCKKHGKVTWEGMRHLKSSSIRASWTTHLLSGCHEWCQARSEEDRLPKGAQPKLQNHEPLSCFCFKSLSLRIVCSPAMNNPLTDVKTHWGRAHLPCTPMSRSVAESVILHKEGRATVTWRTLQSYSHLESGMVHEEDTQKSSNKPLC